MEDRRAPWSGLFIKPQPREIGRFAVIFDGKLLPLKYNVKQQVTERSSIICCTFFLHALIVWTSGENKKKCKAKFWEIAVTVSKKTTEGTMGGVKKVGNIRLTRCDHSK